MRRALLCVLLFPSLANAEPALEEFSGGTISDELRAAMRDALYEETLLLGDPALAPRPAGVAKLRMDDVARRYPREAAVQKYLGRVCYTTGDVTCAEHAYQSAIDLSSKAGWAIDELARFYALRNQPKDELAALDRLAEAERPQAIGVNATTDGKTTLRDTWQRARAVAAAHAGPGVADPAKYDRLVVELYPDDPSYLRRYVDGLLAADKSAAALAEVARYKKSFPGETRYFAQVESQVAEDRRDADRAEAVYKAIFAKSAMPAVDGDGLYDDYLDLLKREGREREVKRALSAKARGGKLAGGDLALLVHLLSHDGDRDQARTILDDASATAGSATEMLLRARLYATVGAPALAAPILYNAYRKATTAKEKEESLGELGLALLSGDTGRTGLTPLGPLDGFRLRHLASGPSVAGGLASLLWNGVHRGSAADLDQVEAAYGNGARAGAVLVELKKVAPKSKRTAALMRALVDFRRDYRDDADAVRLADEFARSFSRDPAYFDVARAGCDSRWKLHGNAADCYVRLLDEATRRGDGRAYEATLREVTAAYETEHKQVEIVRLYWGEIGKRPWDAALYEQFLEHLSRHNLFDDELKVYQEGVKHFGSATWYDRLARWHLKHRGRQSFRELTERLLLSLDDDVAAEYVESQVNWRSDEDDSRLFYETIYRHALDRFPLDERFARRLITFYDSAERGDHRRAMQLVHRYAFFDPALQSRTLAELASDGALERTVATLAKGKSVLERELAASGLTFLSRQEEAEPLLSSVCADFPGDVPLARRHAALVRALGKPSSRAAAQSASGLLDGLTKLFPADEALVTEAGDYLSEANLFDEASKRYERIVQIRPSDPEAYLRLASIDWDYFHFDLAAEAIGRARKRSGDPLRFADKLAAVYESRKDYPKAIAEYVRLVVGAQRLDARTRIFASDERRGEEGENGEGGEGDWRDQGRADDPGSGAALDRLRYLADRKKLGAAVDKAWRAQVATGDGRAVLGYSAYLATVGDAAARRTLLIAEAGKSNDPRLLERIAGDARGNAEMEGVLIAALARESALGKGAPSYVYPLVDALAAEKRDADAERELAAVIARLDGGGEDDREEAIAAHVVYADFLWQRSRWDDALKQRDAAAARADGERKIAFQLDAIHGRIDRGKLDEAEKAARALVDQHPGASRFVDPLAEVLWKRGDRDGTIALYEAQMKAARATSFSDEVKRSMVIQLRHGMIARLDTMGRAREAVDQWIEIVNRAPTNLAEVATLHHFAAAHALVPRVVGYYDKTAHASPKDYRWPVVLATLADLEGDPKGAAAHLGEALAVSPDRIDLATERAEALSRALDAAGAATVYHRLWELGDHDPKWAALEGTMLARAGKRAEAVASIKRLVENDPPEPESWWRAAELLDRAGLLDDAWPLAARAVEKAAKDLHGQSLDRTTANGYARLAVRTGHTQEAWKTLRALEERAHVEAGAAGNSEPWRASSTSDACADAVNDALPHAVASFADDADARRFADTVRSAAHGDGSYTFPERAARIAVAAGRPDLAREIYQRERPTDDRDHFLHLLLSDYEAAGQWEAMVKLITDRGLSDGSDLLALARACRVLGDACEESALKRYVAIMPTYGQPESWRFGGRDAALERYLDLCVARKREAELQALAARGTLHAGQIVDYLFSHGRSDLGQQAIDAAARSESPAWRNAKQASALLALGGNGAKARDLLAALLATRPIGGALGHHPDPRLELESRRWYRYGERYGDALAQAGQTADARRWYAVTVEDQPLSSAAYVAHGDALTRIADHTRAQAAYEHALELKASGTTALDHLARSHLAAGDKKGALATWDRLLAGKRVTERAHRQRFELVLAAGLTDEARAPYADHVAAGWKNVATAEALADLRALGGAYASHVSGSEWERYLRGLLDRSSWRDLTLLGAMASGDLLDGAAREPYLRMVIDRGPPESRSAGREALAAWGIEQRHFDATLDAVAAEVKAAGNAPAQWWTVLQRARARAGKGEVGSAAVDLVAATVDRTDAERLAAADLLAEIHSPREWEVRLALYRDKVGRVDHEPSDEIALADVELRLGQKDPASQLLRRLVVRKLDDAEGYELAAATAEKWKQAALARDLRRALAQISPREGQNLLALARDERDAGAPLPSVKLAAQVVGDRALEVAARRDAGVLLGDLAHARSDGATAAMATLAPQGADEPLLLARAHADDNGQPLADGLPQLAAPRTALTELTARALKRGRHAEAAGFMRRLRALGVYDGATRRQQFAEERAAGHPGAALAALADEEANRWITTVTVDRAEIDPNTERALAATLDRGRIAFAALPNGEGSRLAKDAATAAGEAGDPTRAGYYLALVDALAPSTEAHTRAAAARQSIDKRRRTSARRFITAGIDDLTIAPSLGGVR